MDHVAGAKPRGKERPRRAPVVGPPGLQAVGGSGRGEQAGGRTRLDGRQAAERRRLRLQGHDVGLARERQLGERGAAGDRRGVHVLQHPGEAGGLLLGMADLAPQGRHERSLARLGPAGLQIVVEIA